MFLRALLVLGSVLSINGNAAEVKEGSVMALFGKSDQGASGIYVYSKEPLRQVLFWSSNKSWSSASTLPKQGENNVYRVRLSKAPAPGTVFTITARLPDGSRFQNALKAGEVGENEQVPFEVTETKFEDAATVAAWDKKVQAEAQARFNATREGQFMMYLNNYRRQCGLNPVAWCPTCANIAATNNARGGGATLTRADAVKTGPVDEPMPTARSWPGENPVATTPTCGPTAFSMRESTGVAVLRR